MWSNTPIDPTITEAMVMHGAVAAIGSPVKYVGQNVTAVVEGFLSDPHGSTQGHLLVRVRPNNPDSDHGNTWSAHHTELITEQ